MEFMNIYQEQFDGTFFIVMFASLLFCFILIQVIFKRVLDKLDKYFK